jgi:transketolase
MRDQFCQSMIALGQAKPLVFLTGDLGFKALEPLQAALGPRFINAGVAEQNMVSVAAGLAADGTQAFAYSIAPFIYARPFEQVRNDVCLHGLDVKLVGNGGGYGYGSMGATHHAIEDYGVLLTLQGMRAYVPAFDEDVEPALQALSARKGPAYLRLGRGEKPAGWSVPAYEPWRFLLDGGGPVLLAVGPLAGSLVGAALALDPARRPQIWALSELPSPEAPPAFLRAIQDRGHLAVAEEHVAQGSAGAALALALGQSGHLPPRFQHFCAKGYPSGSYGSQQFHRAESGIDAASILRVLGAG